MIIHPPNVIFCPNLPVISETYQVQRGIIGSGERIITSKDFDIIKWLKTYNRKTLCVETEAYGFSLPYEESKEDCFQSGVLIIRGISDKPINDVDDKDTYRSQCSYHAVQTMSRIIELIPKLL